MITATPKAITLLVTVILMVSFLAAHSNPAGDDSTTPNKNISAGLNLSTMGVGVTLTRRVSKRFDIRFVGSYLGYTYDVHKLSADLQGDAKLKVGAIGSYLDFYLLPFLYLTGGLAYNLTSVDVVAQDAESVSLGDIILEPKDIGVLNAKITPGLKIEPYFGGGLNFHRNRKLSFGVEFGLFLIGPPKVKLKATGMLEPTASTAQEQIIEKNISPLIYYPNVSLRITYRIK